MTFTVAPRTLEVMQYRRSNSGFRIRGRKVGVASLSLKGSVDVGRLKGNCSESHHFAAQ